MSEGTDDVLSSIDSTLGDWDAYHDESVSIDAVRSVPAGTEVDGWSHAEDFEDGGEVSVYGPEIRRWGFSVSVSDEWLSGELDDDAGRSVVSGPGRVLIGPVDGDEGEWREVGFIDADEPLAFTRRAESNHDGDVTFDVSYSSTVFAAIRAVGARAEARLNAMQWSMLLFGEAYLDAAGNVLDPERVLARHVRESFEAALLTPLDPDVFLGTGRGPQLVGLRNTPGITFDEAIVVPAEVDETRHLFSDAMIDLHDTARTRAVGWEGIEPPAPPERVTFTMPDLAAAIERNNATVRHRQEMADRVDVLRRHGLAAWSR